MLGDLGSQETMQDATTSITILILNDLTYPNLTYTNPERLRHNFPITLYKSIFDQNCE